MVTSLTAYESELVRDSKVLLTKNLIIEKVYRLFGKLASEYQVRLTASPVVGLTAVQAKISRGENYRGLPYVMLDSPRIFSKESTFAIRSFFWWGNFFSITLQLSGGYQQRYQPLIAAALQADLLAGWAIGCGEGPWEHHFEKDNYQTVSAGEKYAVRELSYLKIAKKIPLEKWDEAEPFFKESFGFLINLLGS